MFIHIGAYRWRPTRVAFRRDYCIHCAAERIAIQIRTFDVLNVFWIPLLPLGYWRRWHCSVCGQYPDAPRTARRSVKIVLAILLAGLAAVAWLTPAENLRSSAEVATFWGIRIGIVVAFFATLRWIAVGSGDVIRKERLEVMQMSAQPILECPACGVPLRPGLTWSCPRCGMVRA